MVSALVMLAFRCHLVLELSHSDCLHQCLISTMADPQPVCIAVSQSSRRDCVTSQYNVLCC